VAGIYQWSATPGPRAKLGPSGHFFGPPVGSRFGPPANLGKFFRSASTLLVMQHVFVKYRTIGVN